MTPYADFLYFAILLYPFVPTLLVGLALGWPRRLAQGWLLLASAAMLAVQYSNSIALGAQAALPVVALVAAFGAFEWLVGLAFVEVRRVTKARLPFVVALVLALAPLAAAKFGPFAFPATPIGFIGISYVTFRALDVIFNVQDRLITSLPPLQYLAYLLFFPTISSGPIDRYRRFAADWGASRGRLQFLQDLDGAVHRVFTGFLYKFILAALIKQYWLDPVSTQAGVLPTISYMYAYAFYLFFDFAGYSHFAIGVSYLFGIHTPENFDRPYFSRNIREFWNRWHMTLSFWFRDHVYMRFVMAATKGKWFTGKYTAGYLGFFLSFGLMGLWHGTAAHYLLYGLYHAVLLSGFDWFSRWNRTHKLWGEGRLWTVAAVLITFHVVAFGFLMFSGHLF